MAAMVLLVAAAGCDDASADSSTSGGEGTEDPVTLSVRSSAFSAGDLIPTEHTCDGEDVSPPLTWSGAPAETRSFAIVVDDPDAPSKTWVHWLVYGLPSTVTRLDEGASSEGLPGSAREGRNDFDDVSWGGPCPPVGPAHRYYFRVFALDETLSLEAGARRAELESAMEGHVIGRGEAMGHYQRSD